MTRETMAAILAVVVMTSCGDTVDATSAETTSQTAGDYEQVTSGDVHLWAHATPGDGSGEGAIVAGVLSLDADSSCLVLESDGSTFPVVWPHGTELLDDDPVRIGLPDGSEITVGAHLEGGGGYHQADGFAFEVPVACVSATGEIAHFNQQSAIEISE